MKSRVLWCSQPFSTAGSRTRRAKSGMGVAAEFMDYKLKWDTKTILRRWAVGKKANLRSWEKALMHL